MESHPCSIVMRACSHSRIAMEKLALYFRIRRGCVTPIRFPSAVMTTLLSAYLPGLSVLRTLFVRMPTPSVIVRPLSFATRLAGTVQFTLPFTLPQRWMDKVARDAESRGDTVTAAMSRAPRFIARTEMSVAVTLPTVFTVSLCLFPRPRSGAAGGDASGVVVVGSVGAVGAVASCGSCPLFARQAVY